MSEPSTAAAGLEEFSLVQHHMDHDDMSVAQGVNCQSLQYDHVPPDQDQQQHTVAALQRAEDPCKQQQQDQLTPLIQIGLEAINNRKKEIHVKVNTQSTMR